MGEFADVVKEVSDSVGYVRGMRGKKYTCYALTEAGREVAEQYGGSGLEWEVLNHLVDNPRRTPAEIADGLHVEEKKVKEALERLRGKGRVINVSR